MSFAWFLLLLAVTVGNLALGFALACLFGHGPNCRALAPRVLTWARARARSGGRHESASN
ncbi:MAG TPA: hypothetical protein VMP01_10920 [Pirellulaceae bacterium]|nr:hypothetical protein [Pirellulaceae bacterium]